MDSQNYPLSYRKVEFLLPLFMIHVEVRRCEVPDNFAVMSVTLFREMRSYSGTTVARHRDGLIEMIAL